MTRFTESRQQGEQRYKTTQFILLQNNKPNTSRYKRRGERFVVLFTTIKKSFRENILINPVTGIKLIRVNL